MKRVQVWCWLLGSLQACAGSAAHEPDRGSGGSAVAGASATSGGGGASPGGGTSAQAGTSGTAPAGGMPSNVGGQPTSGTAGSAGSATTGGAGGSPVGVAGSMSGGSGGEIPDWSDLLAPKDGALLGAYIGSGTAASTEGQLGRKWALVLQYFDWGNDFTSFARSELSAGRIPYVTWEPWRVTLDAIASGSQDSTIRSRAMSLAGLDGKVLLRFAHEMNGDWYPWDGADNGANAAAPPKYIAAYRHIHEVFASVGAKNVLFVFCPNVDSVPNEPWNNWENYYPGDEYVDWMCFDGYNWSTDTFASMTSRIYPSLAMKNKPILLGETSTHEEEKATFVSAIIPALKTQFPRLKALVWFHVDKENDWRYDSTPSSLSSFVAMAKDPYFNP